MGMGQIYTFDREQYVGVGNCRNTDRRSGTAGSGQLELWFFSLSKLKENLSELHIIEG